MSFPHTKRAITVKLIGGLVIVAMTLCGLGFLVSAVFFALEAWLPRGAAAALTACAAFAVAGLAARLTFGRRRYARPIAGRAPPAMRSAGLRESLEADLRRIIGRHPQQAVLAALSAGIVLGISPAGRGLVLRLLDRASGRL